MASICGFFHRNLNSTANTEFCPKLKLWATLYAVFHRINLYNGWRTFFWRTKTFLGIWWFCNWWFRSITRCRWTLSWSGWLCWSCRWLSRARLLWSKTCWTFWCTPRDCLYFSTLVANQRTFGWWRWLGGCGRWLRSFSPRRIWCCGGLSRRWVWWIWVLSEWNKPVTI